MAFSRTVKEGYWGFRGGRGFSAFSRKDLQIFLLHISDSLPMLQVL